MSLCYDKINNYYYYFIIIVVIVVVILVIKLFSRYYPGSRDYYHPTETAADVAGEVITYASTLVAGKVR